MIKIGAYGRGLAAIFGVGAIILASMENAAWKTFLVMAVIIWVAGFFLGKYARKNKRRRRTDRRRRRRLFTFLDIIIVVAFILAIYSVYNSNYTNALCHLIIGGVPLAYFIIRRGLKNKRKKTKLRRK